MPPSDRPFDDPNAPSSANPSIDPDGAARAAMRLVAPTFADRWEPRGELGVGGMGVVTIVYDRHLGRELAIKTPASPADRDRLAREAQVTARLDHPGIVAVYDAGTSPTGEPWFAMRLVRGRSLAALLRDSAERTDLLRHVLAAAEAVAYAHSRGVVHRDLKPANIMIGAFGETQIIDWGLALSPDRPTPSDRAGTPSAMAPEQARGEPIDARADVYALGAILRHVVVGEPLFGRADTAETLAALAAGAVPPLPEGDIAVELRAIIAHAMAANADDRYPDAKAFADDLLRYLDGRRVNAHRYSPLELLRRLVRAWRVPLAIAALGLVTLAVALTLAFDRVEEALALTLKIEARRALSLDLRGPAEIFARAAYEHVPLEARGILMALPAERATRTFIADLGCVPNDVVVLRDGRTRVVCRSNDAVELIEDGVRRWRLDVRAAAAVFLAGGDEVLVYRDGRALDHYRPDGTLIASRTPPCGSPERVEPGGARWAFAFASSCVARITAHDVRDVVVHSDVCHRLAGPSAHIRAATVSDHGVWAFACQDGDVVVGSGDPLTVRRFDAGLPTPPSSGLPTVLAFESDTRLLIGNDRGELRRIDLEAFVPGPAGHTILPLGRSLVRDITIDPSGSYALVVLDGAAPGVIDLRRWASLGRLSSGPASTRPRIAFEADGRFVLAHERLDRWDVHATTPRGLAFAGGISTLSVSGDGRWLALGWGNTVQLIDADLRRVVATHRWPTFIKSVALGPSGDMLAVAPLRDVDSGEAPSVHVLDARTATAHLGPATVPARMPGDSNFRRVAVLADGTIIGVDYSGHVTRFGADRQPVRGDLYGVDLATSPDGRYVLVQTRDQHLHRAHDLHLGGAFTPFAIDRVAIDIAIEDDGTVWSLSSDRIHAWRSATEPLPTIELPDADLVVVAAAADLIAAGAKDGTIYVWKKGATREPWAIVRDHEMRVDTLVIEPRGRWLAAGSWEGRLSFLRRPDEVEPGSLEAAEAHWGITLDALLRAHH